MNYLSFWFESFKISFKQTIEFKSNFYSAFILNCVFFGVIVLFSKVFFDVVGLNLGWSFSDFILFGFLLNLLFDVSGFFWYGYMGNLVNQIKTGDINSYLTKPGNQFFLFLLKPRYNPIVFVVLDLICYLIFLSFLTDFVFVNVFYGVLILIFAIVFNVFLVHFLMSFSWIFVELGGVLMNRIYWDSIQENLRNYPFQIFYQNSSLFLVLSFLPMSLVSLVLVPVFSKGDFSGFDFFNFYYLFGFIFFMVLVLIFNWKYGLKIYEAYG